MEDLKWFGLKWDEGAFMQSERRQFYFEAWEKLRAGGFIYPCRCSRKDVLSAGVAPHDENEEPIYPGTCRSSLGTIHEAQTPAGINWRFRVPEGEEMVYVDLARGEQRAIARKDFGDFVVWRKDDVPAYQLAVVADDIAMLISEVVRGEDLLLSTFRQLLIYRALNENAPKFFHAPLIVDESGKRLAKRNAAMSLRALREAGAEPEQLREQYL
ncbi:MAG: glutamyl-tRNA synthetase [Verrucomicrobiota bacterium]